MDIEARQKSQPTRRALLLGALVAAVAIALAVAVKVGIERHYEETQHFATAADIPARNGLFVLPPWAPPDARDITIKVQTQGDGRSMTFKSSDLATDDCVATRHPNVEPVPDLDLPDRVVGANGFRCGQWFVVSDRAMRYAWDAYAPR